MRAKSLILLVATAAVVLVADQLSKAAVRVALPIHEPVWLIPGVLSLNHVRNVGAAFSLLPGQRLFFIAIAVGVLLTVAWVWWRYRPYDPWVIVALGLVAGGASGNLVDRVTVGTVTDFIDVQVWPVFNVADSCLVVGVAILVVWLLFGQPSHAHGADAGETPVGRPAAHARGPEPPATGAGQGTDGPR